MENPVRSLPMFNPRVPDGTFRRGFMGGAASGALMMGIFSTVMLVGSFFLPIAAPGFISALSMIGLGGVSTGLFSGIMASRRAGEAAESASLVSRDAPRREPVRAPEMTVAPVISADRAEEQGQGQTNWRTRVGERGTNGRDRVSQIIADRSLNDGERAAAILRERQQAAHAETSR